MALNCKVRHRSLFTPLLFRGVNILYRPKWPGIRSLIKDLLSTVATLSDIKEKAAMTAGRRIVGRTQKPFLAEGRKVQVYGLNLNGKACLPT